MDNGQELGRRHSHRENPIGATTVVVNKDESRVPGFGSCVRGMGAKLRPLLPAGAGVCAVGRQMVDKTAPFGAVSDEELGNLVPREGLVGYTLWAVDSNGFPTQI